MVCEGLMFDSNDPHPIQAALERRSYMTPKKTFRVTATLMPRCCTDPRLMHRPISAYTEADWERLATQPCARGCWR